MDAIGSWRSWASWQSHFSLLTLLQTLSCWYLVPWFALSGTLIISESYHIHCIPPIPFWICSLHMKYTASAVFDWWVYRLFHLTMCVLVFSDHLTLNIVDFLVEAWYSLEQYIGLKEDKLSSTTVDFIRSEGNLETKCLYWFSKPKMC